MHKSLIATTLAAGAVGAAVALSAPASADSKGNSTVGCSPCDRVNSSVTDAVTDAAKSALTGGVDLPESPIVEKWTNFPGKTAEKWGGFPGRTAEKWGGFPGRTAEKWGGFPGKVLKKWTGLG
ncbi:MULTISPECIES: hypothetical protein [Mycobacterium]|uniref:Uncharacterized protein n=1 Tax=Mycobacterium syngnathidarum TaxID=1908205 RepID=A0A1Q9WBF6_9MYCO|nr:MULTISPECIES: hypothetical protein [Mycobacterium]MCG7610494.1 hypothetical protein [Mycobacterium sp. CnD-18-1]OHT90716.1 hypothetical protein BKG61_26910 [Mycobacterium syngnathidarum]OLT96101.1 hypothetical protein BKG60_13230 [Mycobacterium syngnathidarum]